MLDQLAIDFVAQVRLDARRRHDGGHQLRVVLLELVLAIARVNGDFLHAARRISENENKLLEVR